MINFKKFIESYTEISDLDWHVIQNAFQRNEFSKNEIILHEGNICKNLYFLEKGIVRVFINEDGEDITKFFIAAPSFFTSANSFRPQKPAKESFQALEKTIVWQASLSRANDLLELKTWITFSRKFIHEVQAYTEELMWEIKTKTAEERYFELLKKYPELIKKIPLKHLSSFLGIAAQSLSRIRKKL
jgi:CRP-like cAMP-binding protein